MENRVKDLIRFYLQKHVRQTLIKINLIMKNDVYIYIYILFRKDMFNKN
jgi:hypothetical protein